LNFNLEFDIKMPLVEAKQSEELTF
jgi:hypothetical protein